MEVHRCVSVCVLMRIQGYFHIYSYADGAVRKCVCVVFFVFVMNASLSASPEDTTATEMLNPVSGLFNYSYCYCGALAQRVREREGGMEEAAIEERQKDRAEKEEGVFYETQHYRWNMYVASGSISTVSLSSALPCCDCLSQTQPSLLMNFCLSVFCQPFCCYI